MTVAEAEKVRVRSVWDMPDDIFIKHLLTRHADDFKSWNLEEIRHYAKGWSNPWRAYHDRLHEIAVPNQYNHDHSRRR